MKHISVIVPEGPLVLSSVVGAFKLFGQVNNFLIQMGKEPKYKIDLVGLKKSTVLYEGLFEINTSKQIGDIKKTDLVIVTTIMGDMERSIQMNQEFLPWIKKQYMNGAEVSSLCMGAFLLAATGLLNGHSATTHWIGISKFKEMFPEVDLIHEKIITDEKGLYTSGGAYSFLNLLVYLIEKQNGREMAIQCAKLFEIDIDRYTQSDFVIFDSQKQHGDTSIQDIQLHLENNFELEISLSDLADQFNLSKRNLIRRFKKATDNTPYEYLQRVRIEAAKKLFERESNNVQEVMLKVGYADIKAFRNVFKKFTGMTPHEYRLKYNINLVKRLEPLLDIPL